MRGVIRAEKRKGEIKLANLGETNDFGSRYGFAPSNQEIPYYKGLDKMHELPDPETRFISSSAKSEQGATVPHIHVQCNYAGN